MNLPIHPILYDIATGLRSHPGRTLLSFLGIAVGPAALSILWNVTDALRLKASQMQSDFGVNIFSISHPPDETGEQRAIRRAHIRLLAENLPETAVSGWQAYALETDAGKNPFRLLVTDEHLPEVRPWTLTSGRFLDHTDICLRRPVAVLSKTLADLENLRPGDTLTIRQAPFTVIGILDTGVASLESADFHAAPAAGERAVFIPWSIAPNWVDAFTPPEENLDVLFVKVCQPDRMEGLLAQARTLLAQPDYAVPDAEWITPETVTERIRQWQHLIEWSAGGIALLCLALGGATLMSLMVSNINERIPEIGLRLALGAGRGQIVALFLLESFVISVLAALSGAAFAQLALMVSRSHLPIALPFSASAVGLPVLLTLLLSALFSIWPAMSAGRITPAEALRND